MGFTSFMNDVTGGLYGGVKSAIGSAAGAVESAFESAGRTIENVLKDPLPVIETAALTYALGPEGYAVASEATAAAMAQAAVRAANGGNMQDIALAVATSYAGAKIGSAVAAELPPDLSNTIKQVVASSSGSAAVTALRGGSLENILQSGVAGAVNGYVAASLKDLGYTNVDQRLIANAASAATNAILKGKSVGDAIGQSVASTALSAAMQGKVSQINKNNELVNGLNKELDYWKTNAEGYYKSNIAYAEKYVDGWAKEVNKYVDQYNQLKEPALSSQAAFQDLYAKYQANPTDEKLTLDTAAALKKFQDDSAALQKSYSNYQTANYFMNDPKIGIPYIQKEQQTFERAYIAPLTEVSNKIASLNQENETLASQIGEQMLQYKDQVLQDDTGLVKQIGDQTVADVMNQIGNIRHIIDSAGQGTEVAALSPLNQGIVSDASSGFLSGALDWETASSKINSAVEDDIKSGYLKPNGDGSYTAPDGTVYLFNDQTGMWDSDVGVVGSQGADTKTAVSSPIDAAIVSDVNAPTETPTSSGALPSDVQTTSNLPTDETVTPTPPLGEVVTQSGGLHTEDVLANQTDAGSGESTTGEPSSEVVDAGGPSSEVTDAGGLSGLGGAGGTEGTGGVGLVGGLDGIAGINQPSVIEESTNVSSGPTGGLGGTGEITSEIPEVVVTAPREPAVEQPTTPQTPTTTATKPVITPVTPTITPVTPTITAATPASTQTTSPLSQTDTNPKFLDTNPRFLETKVVPGNQPHLQELKQLYSSLTPELAAALADRGIEAPIETTSDTTMPTTKFMADGGDVSKIADSLNPTEKNLGFVKPYSPNVLPAAPLMQNQMKLNPLRYLHESLISRQRTAGGLAHGGLSQKYAEALPAGHKPEFITGLTGYYASGKGTGQSDDIDAMLHDGDYVADADLVAALGDGSSKAGAEALEKFRRQIPHQEHAVGGAAVAAKIADGEYVFPASFVTAIGRGDNKAGAKILDKMREAIREHKRSAPVNKIPPKAKSPLEYLKMVKG